MNISELIKHITGETLISKKGVKSKLNKYQKLLRVEGEKLKGSSILGYKEEILEKPLFWGPFSTAQTAWEYWVCSQLSEGTFSNPYLGHLRLPNFPLSEQTGFKNAVSINKRLTRANKYLTYQEVRLNKAIEKGDSKLYWAISNSLMKRSRSAYVYFLNKSAKGWYYRTDFDRLVSRWERLVRKKARYEFDDQSYSAMGTSNLCRSYIVKSNGKLRPIGAPSREDRIYLSMLAYFLGKWVHKGRKASDHGFKTGRGLWSAWMDLMPKLEQYDNILEYDIKGFFNRVPLTEVFADFGAKHSLDQALRHWNVPEHMIDKIIRLNQSYPHRAPVNNGKLLNLDVADPEMWHLWPSKSYWELMKTNKTNQENSRLFDPEFIGMTQGSPLSPILGAIYLDWLDIGKRIKADQEVTYADDGIWFFQNRPSWYNKLSEKFQSIEKGINELFLTGSYNHTYLKGLDTALFKHRTRILEQLKKINQKVFDLKGLKTPLTKEKLFKYYAPERSVLGPGEWFGFGKELTSGAFEFSREKSRWLKLHGKWQVKEVKFLGSIYDTEKGTLNGIPVQDLNFRNLWKVVGRTYNMIYPEKWLWKIHRESMLRKLMNQNLIAGLEQVEARLNKAEEKKTGKKVYELSQLEKAIVTESSTICSALYLIRADSKR